MKIRNAAIATMLGIATVTASHSVFSQELQAPIEQSATNYSESELKSFATAAIEVRKIQIAYAPQYQGATSAEEQQQVQQTAVEEMARAIQKEGISVDKYNEIVGQIRTNPGIAERVRGHLDSSTTQQ